MFTIILNRFSEVLPAFTCESSINSLCSICFGSNILIPLPWVKFPGVWSITPFEVVGVIGYSDVNVLPESSLKLNLVNAIGNILLLKALITFYRLRSSLLVLWLISGFSSLFFSLFFSLGRTIEIIDCLHYNHFIFNCIFQRNIAFPRIMSNRLHCFKFPAIKYFSCVTRFVNWINLY